MILTMTIQVLRGSLLLVFKKKGDPSATRTIILNSDGFVAEITSSDPKYFDFAVSFGREPRLSISSTNSAGSGVSSSSSSGRYSYM